MNASRETHGAVKPDNREHVSVEVSLSPIAQQSSLATLAFEHIKAAIIVGDIVAGPLYTVTQFASALGVSRTPVREALIMLSQEGVLEMVRNKGFRVGAVTEKELQEIFELRMLLEVPAMRRLAELDPRPEEAFVRARELYEQLQDAADNSNVLEFLRIDRQFHVELTSTLGNDQLTSLVGNLRDRVHLPGLRNLADSGRLHDSGAEHRELLLALESGNAKAAAVIMQTHIERTQREWKAADVKLPG